MSPKSLALLGLNEYEGRVYRALLAESGATAYRLGKRSGVPLSRVYEIANRLVEKGVAVREGGEPARYAPVPPEVLVSAARSRSSRELDALGSELASLYAGAESAAPQWIRGEEAVIARVAAMAAGAEGRILVAAGSAVLRAVRDALDSRGARVRLSVHELPPTARREGAIYVSADDSVVLIGRLGPESDAIVTSHPPAVRLCADYIRSLATERPAGRVRAAQPSRFPFGPEWLDFEEQKQRRLLRAH